MVDAATEPTPAPVPTTPQVEAQKRQYSFFFGLILGVVGAGILAPIIMFFLGAFDEEQKITVTGGPTPIALACQTYYGSGGAASETLAAEVANAQKRSERDPEALSKLFVTVKTGLAASSTVPGLTKEEFGSFKALAEVTEKTDYAFASTDSYAYLTKELVTDLRNAVDSVTTLCGAQGT